MASGFKFPTINSDGSFSSTVNDFDDIFVKKDLFLNAGMWSCGYNLYGSLGNNTTISYSSPIQVGSLTNWKQVVGNQWSAAAIKTDGTLWTWGYNTSGQLGLGDITNRSSPVQVGLLTNWKQLSSSSSYVLSIKTDGSLWSWGLNGYWQLGNNTTNINYSSPIQVGSLTNWKQVAAGSYQCAGIKTDGTLWAWGRNDKGQLGNGVTVHYSSPIQIGSLTNWKQVSVGAAYMSAIKTDGTLWTCGYNNTGQLGLGDRTSRSSPTQVGSATNWKQVFCGDTHLLAIKTDGTLWACGYNIYGQLGNGTSTHYSSPVQVGLLTNWKQITSTVGGNFGTVAAIKTDGTLWTWGYNSGGQLGNNTIINYSSPIQVGSLTNWKQVTGGGQTVLAIQSPDLP